MYTIVCILNTNKIVLLVHGHGHFTATADIARTLTAHLLQAVQTPPMLRLRATAVLLGVRNLPMGCLDRKLPADGWQLHLP